MGAGIKLGVFSGRGVGRVWEEAALGFVLWFGNAARVSPLGLERVAFKLEHFLLSHAEQRTRDT